MNVDSSSHSRIAQHCPCCGGDAFSTSPAILMPFIADRVFGWKPQLIDESWGLQTVPKGMAYSICNSILCRHCGFLFLDIRFTDSELSALYSGYRDDAYVSLREFYEPGYSQRNRELLKGIEHMPEIVSFLEPFVPEDVRLLDWGGDTGKNTPFKDRVSLFHIYEISNVTPVDGAQRVDIETCRRTSYDLVVLSQVLEHVPFPLEVLRDVYSVMSDTSVLYIEVPHEQCMLSPQRRQALPQAKRHWHEHINFFSESSLKELLSRCNLEVCAIRSLPICESKSNVFQVVAKKER